jgi:hypothetical protein
MERMSFWLAQRQEWFLDFEYIYRRTKSKKFKGFHKQLTLWQLLASSTGTEQNLVLVCGFLVIILFSQSIGIFYLNKFNL